MSDDNTPQHDGERDLLEVEALLRSLTVDDLDAPPPAPAGLWTNIQAELRSTGDLAAPFEPALAPSAVAPVTSLAEHRERTGAGRRPFLLAAAAVAVMIAGAVVVVATRGGDAEVLASAQLTWATDFDPLGEGATSTAELVDTGDGYQLVIDDTTLPAGVTQVGSEADLELWMISTDPITGEITDVQPVQKIAGSPDGTYAVPAALDPDTYTVVDISIEPRDGDEAHSGRSILRGQLSA